MKALITIATLLLLITHTNAQYWDWVKTSFAGHYQTTASDKNSNIYVHSSFDGTATVGNTVLTSTANKSAYIARYDTLGNVIWAKQIVFGNRDLAAQDIAVNANNDIYVSGVVNNPNNVDHYLAKYDSSGNQLWWRLDNLSGSNIENYFFQSQNNHHYYHIATDEDGNVFLTSRLLEDIIISGNTIKKADGNYSSCFIIKFDNNGQYLWGYNYHGERTSIIQARDITVDDNGDAILIAQIQSGDSVIFHNLSLDISTLHGFYHRREALLIAKYTGIEGKVKWAKTSSGGKSNNIGSQRHGIYPNCVATDRNNDIYVTGFFRDSAAFGNYILADTNEYYLGNSLGLLHDAFLVKYNTNGQEQWAATIGDTTYSGSVHIAVNNFNEVFVTTEYGYRLYQQHKQKFSKYDVNGNLIWSTTALTNTRGLLASLCTDANHNLYIGGALQYRMTSSFDPLKFGNTIALPYNTSNTVYLAKISPNPPNNITHINTNKNINIYPNPIHHQLHIDAEEVGVIITLYNVVGKQVYKAVTTSKQHTINTTSFASGVYIVSVTDTKGNTYTSKLTKQ